jgi:hypothetical protein
MAIASAVRPAPEPSGRTVGDYDRLFYGGMAAALALTVFAGFARTYYLRLLDDGPKATLTGGPFTTLVHLHGALFTSWVLLFIVQTALVSSRKVAVHRKLGVAGAVLAAAMVVAGTSLAIAAAARGSAPPGMDPKAFLILPLFDMILFSIFVTAALANRRDKETHKRLMLLAYVSIIVAAVGRLPVVPVRGGGGDLRPRLAPADAQGLSLGRGADPGLRARAPGHLQHGRLAVVCGTADPLGRRLRG